jgi:hypothetical protein
VTMEKQSYARQGRAQQEKTKALRSNTVRRSIGSRRQIKWKIGKNFKPEFEDSLQHQNDEFFQPRTYLAIRLRRLNLWQIRGFAPAAVPCSHCSRAHCCGRHVPRPNLIFFPCDRPSRFLRGV